MGSIVKTIGKVIKKAGKLLKKIAPVLLVAAAAYVGYGYMTGFQQGGWPQITDWGKSLMGGVSQGMPISEAANAAGGMDAVGGITDGMGLPDMGEAALGETDALMDAMGTPADALTRALPSESITGEAIGEGVGQSTGGMIGGLPSEGGGLLSQIEDTTNTRFTSLMDTMQTHVGPDSRGDIGGKWYDYIMSPAQADSMQTGVPFSGMGDAPSPFTTGHPGMEINQNPAQPFTVGGGTSVPTAVAQSAAQQSTVPYGGANPYGWQSNQYAMPAGAHVNEPGAMGKIAAMGKKAWGIYKGMWKDNPWMAMWTTQKVIETIAALLDDTAEKESYRSRHVAGFEPGNWGDLRKKYGGNLPGGPKAGVWAGDNSRQSSIKTGPQIASRIPTSTLDRKPQGLVGKQVGGVLS